MIEDTNLEKVLEKIFIEHRLVLIDAEGMIPGKTYPKRSVVSPKWLAKEVQNICKRCKQPRIGLSEICCNCNFPK
jgi:hypothetical protein